jgi:guanylate kinase
MSETPNIITPDSENEIFRLAVEFVENTYNHIFLTGKAGTGKTTFLKYIRNNSHKQILVAAPTGVAAINAGGVTLHSLFQLPLEPYIPGTKVKNSFMFNKQKRDLIQQADLLVIDEISMLRADLLDSIDTTLRFLRNNSRPFGGIQMLYIGDMFQLPPVVKDEEWEMLKEYYESPFFFHSKVFAKTKPVYLELKKVYRQREQEFINLLNKLRNNELTPADFAILNERYRPGFSPASNSEKYIVLCTHNYKADNINTEKLAALSGKMHTFKGEVKGDFPDYALPTDKELQLKEGAQVMFIKNDTQKPPRYYNGKIAEISRIINDAIYVRPEGKDGDFKVERETWRNVRYKLNKDKAEIEEEELGSFVQFPLRTAWAITIHKSQGLTFERAIIDVGQAFAAGQTYVALSRCTSLDGIILRSPITPNSVQTNAHALEFADSEQPYKVLSRQLEMGKKQFQGEHLLKFFDFRALLTILNNHNKFTSNKISDELIEAHELSEKLYQIAVSMQITANRFKEQLQLLIEKDDKQKLKERCVKAVDYFLPEIDRTILQALQKHKADYAGHKRAKAYRKALEELEEDIVLFANRLLTIYYNNESMVEGAQSKPLHTSSVLSQKITKPESKDVKTTQPRPVMKAGETVVLTKNMKLAGKTVQQIAEERGLVVGTIEKHLVDLISSGELPLTEFVPQEKVDVILPLVIEEKEYGTISIITSVKEKLGDDYSYSEIRAVMNQYLVDNK